ncbi:MAG: alanine racemase [Acidimicrobiales bacterium]
MSRAWLEIDLDAVAQNCSMLGSFAAGSELCAVVKADGYGHGAVEVATTALGAGASRLAVAQVAEGRQLREAGIDAPIWVLSQPDPAEFEAVAALDLEPALYSREGIELAIAAAGDHRVMTVHLVVDTGMGRVGATGADTIELAQMIVAADELELGSVWTHLARSEELGHPLNDQQLDRFDAVIEELSAIGIDPPLVHAANTAATVSLGRSHLDVVRCGIGLYGCLPGPDLDDLVELRPAMRLVSTVGFVKRVRAGTAVSYGHRRSLTRDSTLATVPIGYADGVPRAWWDTGQVLINGERHGFAGSITMDQVIVDCGDAEVAVGDEVVFLGAQGGDAISAEEWAEVLGTIPYEIVCGFGTRLDRVFRGTR